MAEVDFEIPNNFTEDDNMPLLLPEEVELQTEEVETTTGTTTNADTTDSLPLPLSSSASTLADNPYKLRKCFIQLKREGYIERKKEIYLQQRAEAGLNGFSDVENDLSSDDENLNSRLRRQRKENEDDEAKVLDSIQDYYEDGRPRRRAFLAARGERKHKHHKHKKSKKSKKSKDKDKKKSKSSSSSSSRQQRGRKRKSRKEGESDEDDNDITDITGDDSVRRSSRHNDDDEGKKKRVKYAENSEDDIEISDGDAKDGDSDSKKKKKSSSSSSKKGKGAGAKTYENDDEYNPGEAGSNNNNQKARSSSSSSDKDKGSGSDSDSNDEGSRRRRRKKKNQKANYTYNSNSSSSESDSSSSSGSVDSEEEFLRLVDQAEVERMEKKKPKGPPKIPDVCKICKVKGAPLRCSTCPAVYHHNKCLNPPLAELPTEPWVCPICVCPPISENEEENRIRKILTWKYAEDESPAFIKKYYKTPLEQRKLMPKPRRLVYVLLYGKSYWHCRWVTSTQVEKYSPMFFRVARNNKFDTEVPPNYFVDDEDEDKINLDVDDVTEEGVRRKKKRKAKAGYDPMLQQRFYDFGIRPEWIRIHRLINHKEETVEVEVEEDSDIEEIDKDDSVEKEKEKEEGAATNGNGEKEEGEEKEEGREKEKSEEADDKDSTKKSAKKTKPKIKKKIKRMSYLTKWCDLPYDWATWETEETCSDPLIKDEFQRHIEMYQEYHSYFVPNSKWKKRRDDYEYISIPPKKPTGSLSTKFTNDKQIPFITDGLKLHDYQVEGLNWLRYSFKHKTNTILADEMGLGKTIQAITFIYSLYKEGHCPGPFLIIAPLSTITNWEREYEKWTDLYVVTYVGEKESRKAIRENEFSYDPKAAEVVSNGGALNKNLKTKLKFHALLTNYETIILDFNVLKSIPWQIIVVDEAHRLKNGASKFFKHLKEYNKAGYKLLLTGTPLQNNLEELFYLLNFLVPKKFDNLEKFMEEFAEIQKEDQIKKMHDMLGPHMLRRLKTDVLKHMPGKKEQLIRVELSPMQKDQYKAILTKNFEALNSKGAGRNASLRWIMVDLKKCCNHPYLFSKAALEAPLVKSADGEEELYELEALTQAAGKLILLRKMLVKLKETGHRVLIFSQMTSMLDVLEDFMTGLGFGYERLDGDIRGPDRQYAIDRFNDPDSTSFAFLLSTKAGGLGLNLATADTVIIYDSDWNPHNDLQALSRAHRIGQKNKVMVYRFVTRASIEERVAQVAKKKMMLVQLVVESAAAKKNEDKMSFSRQELETILRFGTENLFKEEDSKNKIIYSDEMVDDLLNRDKEDDVEGGEGTEQKQWINEYLGSFKVASYATNEEEEQAAIAAEAEKEPTVSEDPAFWAKLLDPEGKLTQQQLIEETEKNLMPLGKRASKYRRNVPSSSKAGASSSKGAIQVVVEDDSNDDSDSDFGGCTEDELNEDDDDDEDESELSKSKRGKQLSEAEARKIAEKLQAITGMKLKPGKSGVDQKKGKELVAANANIKGARATYKPGPRSKQVQNNPRLSIHQQQMQVQQRFILQQQQLQQRLLLQQQLLQQQRMANMGNVPRLLQHQRLLQQRFSVSQQQLLQQQQRFTAHQLLQQQKLAQARLPTAMPNLRQQLTRPQALSNNSNNSGGGGPSGSAGGNSVSWWERSTLKLSPALTKITGTQYMTLQFIEKQIRQMIVVQSLLDPSDPSFAFCNTQLFPIFRVQRFAISRINEYVKSHLSCYYYSLNAAIVNGSVNLNLNANSAPMNSKNVNTSSNNYKRATVKKVNTNTAPKTISSEVIEIDGSDDDDDEGSSEDEDDSEESIDPLADPLADAGPSPSRTPKLPSSTSVTVIQQPRPISRPPPTLIKVNPSHIKSNLIVNNSLNNNSKKVSVTSVNVDEDEEEESSDDEVQEVIEEKVVQSRGTTNKQPMPKDKEEHDKELSIAEENVKARPRRAAAVVKSYADGPVKAPVKAGETIAAYKPKPKSVAKKHTMAMPKPNVNVMRNEAPKPEQVPLTIETDDDDDEENSDEEDGGEDDDEGEEEEESSEEEPVPIPMKKAKVEPTTPALLSSRLLQPPPRRPPPPLNKIINIPNSKPGPLRYKQAGSSAGMSSSASLSNVDNSSNRKSQRLKEPAIITLE